MIKAGNFEDNLGWLADVDWVIEVVIENLKIKQELFAKVEKVVKPDCIVTTNTSGIRSARSRPTWARAEGAVPGDPLLQPAPVHEALEIIPGEETKKEVIEYMTRFCEHVLGKGVVICKDVPNFIGNRIGVFDMSNAMSLMLEKDMKIEDMDAIISNALGRPGSAIFGTLDLVGLDTAYHVMTNLYEAVPKDESRDLFQPPDFIKEMIEQKWLGNKTKQGFYKKIEGRQGQEGQARPRLQDHGVRARRQAQVRVRRRGQEVRGRRREDREDDLQREGRRGGSRPRVPLQQLHLRRQPHPRDLRQHRRDRQRHEVGLQPPARSLRDLGCHRRQGSRRGHEEAGQEGAQEDRGDAQEGLRILLHEEGRRHLLL